MLSAVRRTSLPALALVCLTALAACGDEAAPVETAAGFDAVTVSGQPGQVPEFDWQAMLEKGDIQTEVLQEGDGAELSKGDDVLVNFAVSNEYTQAVDFETYGEDAPAVQLKVGAETGPPQQAADLLTTVLAGEIEPGMTVGTRIAMTIDAAEQWGEDALHLSQVGIGNEDGFVLVADLAATPVAGPKGKQQAAPAWAPELAETKGKPSALDSSGLEDPDPKAKKLAKAVLVKGTGPAVEKGDLVVVNYLGQIHGGDKPFDESFSKKQPFATPLGFGAVVKGWDRGLVGVPVGSRVLLRIPPALGYGKKAQGEDIPANSTLYFVIDVLGAA